MKKPKNKIRLTVTRCDGTQEIHDSTNDLTLRGAARFGFPTTSGNGAVSREPASYAGLVTQPVNYKYDNVPSGIGHIASESRSFVEYLPVVTDGGLRYQPRVDTYVFASAPPSSTTYTTVVFTDNINGLGLYSFADLASPVTVGPDDTVKITYTTYWGVHGSYDGDPDSPDHAYLALSTGSVNVELYDIDGNLVSSTPMPFTVYGMLTVSDTGNTPRTEYEPVRNNKND